MRNFNTRDKYHMLASLGVSWGVQGSMVSTGAKARRRAKQSKIVQNLTIAKETAESLLHDDDDDGIVRLLYFYTSYLSALL